VTYTFQFGSISASSSPVSKDPHWAYHSGAVVGSVTPASSGAFAVNAQVAAGNFNPNSGAPWSCVIFTRSPSGGGPHMTAPGRTSAPGITDIAITGAVTAGPKSPIQVGCEGRFGSPGSSDYAVAVGLTATRVSAIRVSTKQPANRRIGNHFFKAASARSAATRPQPHH
jgi:hypothetical protein